MRGKLPLFTSYFKSFSQILCSRWFSTVCSNICQWFRRRIVLKGGLTAFQMTRKYEETGIKEVLNNKMLERGKLRSLSERTAEGCRKFSFILADECAWVAAKALSKWNCGSFTNEDRKCVKWNSFERNRRRTTRRRSAPTCVASN